MRYIINSAVITTPGLYDYQILTPEQAKNWLEAGEYESTIGYQETADALEALTGVKVACNRRQIKMQAGDEALVFRLTCRLDNPALKGSMTPEFVLQNSEIGLLKKLQEPVECPRCGRYPCKCD